MNQYPPPPSSPSFINPRHFGASGDGQKLDTPALQAAIDACENAGGGTVYIPAGRYLTGSLFLHDNITIYLDSGAALLGSENPNHYPVTSNRWEGMERLTHASLITGSGLKNIAVVGRGLIDGRGYSWWQAYLEKRLSYPRPRLISFSDCANVLIDGLTLINSPSWTVNPVRCENVSIRGLTIVNPPESPNTDGINPDSCRLVRISDCYVSVGDDCITIKAGTQHEHPSLRQTCRDITITNCTLERGHGGLVIGSEMSGDVRNVTVSNCVFIGTDRGVRLKSRRGRGGVVEDVRLSNLIMDGVLCPFTMNLYYHIGVRGDPVVSDKNHRPVDESTPRFRNIHISQVSAVNVKIAAAFLYGLAEMPLEDISFSDVSITLSDHAETGPAEMADDIPSMSRAGFFVRNARRLRLDHVNIQGQIGPALDMDESVEAEVYPL